MKNSLSKLPINEFFTTIQGEATYTGTPSIFFRLQQCPVGCGFCDTKYTWHLDKQYETKDINKIVDKKNLDHSKSEGNPTYMYMNELEILSLAIKSGVRHVVFTGGEPCMYDLTNVTRTLLQYRPSNLYDYFTVQIETSGTFEIRCDPNTWVTVSPKIGKTVQGGYIVRGDSYYRANELKYPVGKMADIESLKTVLNLHQGLYDRNKRNKNIPIWLQPLSTSEKATELCVEQAILNDWRISIQTHKFINAR